MTTSFITNPEIRLIISNKNIPRRKKSSDGKSKKKSEPQQVKFSDRELELLLKLNDLKVEEKTSTNEVSKEKLSKNDKTTSLTLSEVKQLKEELDDSSYLCDFIELAELKLPQNDIVERNPVLEKRIQRLKAEQEQRVYNSMTKNVDSSRKHMPEETIAFQCKSRCKL
jgi:hypothetical protein